jgi:uncharacterized protein (DUF302 family)
MITRTFSPEYIDHATQMDSPLREPFMTTDSSGGIVKLTSPWPYRETVEGIGAVLNAKKMKVFTNIDQAAEAAAVGLTLRPTTLLFGDPSKGTPLIVAHPDLAIDLPLKALVWEAGPSEVYISLTSPEFLQKRHHLPSAPFAGVVRLFSTLLSAGS